jgi:DNA repair exonuclease SbcCD ATPase subunit
MNVMSEELLRSIVDKLDDLGKNLVEFKNESYKKFDLIDQKFVAIDQRFDQVDKKIVAIDQRFDQVDKKIVAIDQRFDQVDQKFERVDQKLNAITDQVVKNSEQLTLLAENQNLLIASQQRQDKILETLALRSIEQETEIRHMKRVK